jgi:ParB family chromosome partitioning protein
LILTKRPPAEGFAWLKYDDDGHEVEANLAEVQLVALVEG